MLDVAERVCDRMAIVARGEVVAVGTLDELRSMAGRDGTLEEVFRVLTHSQDPHQIVEQLLG
jgi:ABC-2 type transport system ATP-binding protein